MSAWVRDLLLFVVTALTAFGCARFYVVAVLEGDRPLSRAAALGVFVFGLAAVFFLLRTVL